MLFKYIAFHYLKNIFIILMSLSGLFAGLDFLMNGTSLPSFNIKLLYVFFKWQEALALLFPLAIVFAGIWTQVSLIKQNAIVAIYALGMTKKELLKPFFFVALLIYLIFLGVNFTSFTTASNSAKQLSSNRYDLSETKDLFFKYDDNFVHIGTLLPKKYRIEDLTIFKMKNNQVIETITAQKAWYNISEWVATNVLKKTLIVDENNHKRLKIETLEILKTLKDYQPQILKSIYNGQTLNLYESFNAMKLLQKQKLETTAIRADIYGKAIMPLFSIALLIIILLNFPFHARYMNSAVTTTKAIGTTLFTWGILFALLGIGKNGTLTPEVAILFPIALLSMVTLYLLKKTA